MERSEIWDWLVIFGIYGWMIGSNILFRGKPDIQSASQIASLILMFSILFVKDKYLCWEASTYLAIEAIIYPARKKVHFFVKRGGESSQEVRNVSNFYTTTLPILPVKLGSYGKVNKVVFKHQFTFDKRVIPARGKVRYKGNWVDHQGKAEVVLYEFTEASVDVDHAEPVPTYYLAHAPGDIIIGPINPTPHMSNPNSNVGATIQRLNRQVLVLKQALAEKSRQASYWHQKDIQHEGYIKHIKEELSGLLRNSPDFMKGIVRYAQSYVMAIDDIRQLAKMGSPWQFRIKALVPIFIAGIFFIFLATQPQLVQDIGTFFSQGQNQLWILIFALITVGGIYYLAKFRRRGKQ